MNQAVGRLKRWKRVEYDQLIEKGIFGPGDRIELIDGLLLVSEPQDAAHYAAIRLADIALTRAFGIGWDVRTQGPVALDDTSEPEPDVAVVPGSPLDYVSAHPAEPVLVVEVALTSLRFDRGRKSSLYARAGRPEYWIVNLVDRVLEVRRDPVRSPSARYGWAYGTTQVLSPGESVSPLAAPSATVSVVDLLPYEHR